jgi:hypothetical protein
LLLYDPKIVEREYFQPGFIQIPFTDIITDLDLDMVMATTVAAGAVLGAIGLEGIGSLAQIIPDFIPVIVQSDQYLADSQWTYDDINIELLQYEDFRLRGSELINKESYQRYAYSANGISPLANSPNL